VAPTAPPAAATCTDKIGCLQIGATDPIHVAYMMVVSGPDSTLGIDTRRGVEIAIDDKGGKLVGHTVKFDGQDDGCGAEGGQAAGTKLAADKTILAVIGGDCSSATTAALPVLATAGLLVVSPAATAPSLTDPAKRSPAFFRSCYNDKIQGALAAKFVWESLKLKTAATIHDGSPYAQQLQQVFADNFKSLGGTITTQEAVQPTDTDMKPVLTKIASGKPDIIYYPVFTSAAGFITAQSKSVAGLEKTILMTADGAFNADFIKAAGQAATGIYQSSPDITALGSAYTDFLAKHLKKYGEAPLSVYHAHGYDAFNMIAAAVEKVAQKNADGSLLIGRQAMRDALAATKDFKGLTGSLTCDPNGDCGANIVAVYQIKSGDPKDFPPKKIYP
jgi:branched-chain amino acid transport system substrate-binding protein